MSLKASPVTLIPSSAKQGLTVMEHRRVTGRMGESFISSVGKRCTQLYPNRGDGRESGKRKAPEHQRKEEKSTKLLPMPLGTAVLEYKWGTEARWDEEPRFPRGF